MPKIIPLNIQIENLEKSSKEIKKLICYYNNCVYGTKEFVKKNGFSDVVLGISGGIDSALVAKIACDAVGKEHVHGLILPGPYSSQLSLRAANELAKNLGIKTNTVFINSSYEAILKSIDLAEICDDEDGLKNLTQQNIQARLRMIFCMIFSNQFGWVLLNTSNKSEVYTGYSTLYGDMAGAFAPIGDVYKTDVYKMCVVKNLQEFRVNGSACAAIPQSIIERPASAELSENQTDEDSLGIDYASLDAILKEIVNNKKTLNEVISLGYPASLVQKVFGFVKKSEFKRHYEPPCAKCYIGNASGLRKF